MKRKCAQQFSFTFWYIDDVLSLNNLKIAGFIDIIYPCEVEIKDTTESSSSASYLNCYPYIDKWMLVWQERRPQMAHSLLSFFECSFGTCKVLQSLSLSFSAMPESASTIKTFLIGGSYSPVNWWNTVIAELNLTMRPLENLFATWQPRTWCGFQLPNFHFHS